MAPRTGDACRDDFTDTRWPAPPRDPRARGVPRGDRAFDDRGMLSVHVRIPRQTRDTSESFRAMDAAAAAYASTRNAYLPSASAEVSGTRLKTAATQGRAAVLQSVYGPSANISLLLLDLGGRGGNATEAREALFAA